LKWINDVELSSSCFLSLNLKDPDWVPGLRIAAGVITNRGGRTCHAAIVSRELGVPCIVGTKDATEKLQTGNTYTRLFKWKHRFGLVSARRDGRRD
jgi:phosphoenolpyruvate synthase/pyruvate phosphate dikinase